MNESPLKVRLAEGGPGEAILSLRTFSTTTGRRDQMRWRIALRLLPFQESNELRTALVFCIDDEVNSGSVHGRPCEFPEAADLFEPPEPCALARP